MMNQITLKDLEDLVKHLDSLPRPQSFSYPIYVGSNSMVMYWFNICLSHYDLKFRYFVRFSSRREKSAPYVEVTPFNKGNLWKFRMYNRGDREPVYRVYYGPDLEIYCTKLSEVIDHILKNQR